MYTLEFREIKKSQRALKKFGELAVIPRRKSGLPDLHRTTDVYGPAFF
jgi:hypothetical protein